MAEQHYDIMENIYNIFLIFFLMHKMTFWDSHWVQTFTLGMREALSFLHA